LAPPFPGSHLEISHLDPVQGGVLIEEVRLAQLGIRSPNFASRVPWRPEKPTSGTWAKHLRSPSELSGCLHVSLRTRHQHGPRDRFALPFRTARTNPTPTLRPSRERRATRTDSRESARLAERLLRAL